MDPDEPVTGMTSLAERADLAGCAGLAGCAALAVILYIDAQFGGRVVQRDHRLGGVGVFEHVGEALLDDPVGGDVEPAGQREAIPGDPQPDGQARSPDLVEQPVETVQPRLWRQFGVVAAGVAHRV